ncbi:MAG: DNA internalization-related competence protein ComEC/Rec2 [Pseudomonadota bacterium]
MPQPNHGRHDCDTPFAAALAVLAGMLAPLVWPPLAVWFPAFLVLGLALVWRTSRRPLAWMALGLALGGQAVDAVRSGWLAPALEGERLSMDVRIEGLPESGPHATHFIAEVVSPPEGLAQGFPRRLRLAWYKQPPALAPGEVWRLSATLKRPHGMVNGMGFDYEAWLFRQGIQATGTVRDGERLRTPSDWSVDALRLSVRARLIERLAGEPSLGLVLGLTLGDRSLIGEGQWDALIATGTNHLLAISGMHVTMIAGLVWVCSAWIWRRVPALALRCPAPLAGALAGAAAALAYSLLAGFSVPTQRTLLMLLAAVLALLSRRAVRARDVLGVAALFVLLYDPLSVLDVGFWLSFGAVALLIYAAMGGLGRSGWLTDAVRAQWAVTLGLAPLTVLLFQRASLVSPLANAFAIPLVTLLVTPLALVGTLLLFVFEPAGAALLWCAARALDGLLWLLTAMAGWPLAQWFPAFADPWLFLLAVPAIGWVLAPRGIPARWLGLVLLLPLVWPRLEQPGAGSLWLDMFDVGQGQAILLRTAGHAMLYDAGPLGFSGFDTGAEVVLPALRALGLRRLDAVMLSNGDRDHAGGVNAIREALPVASIRQGGPSPDGCRAGLEWTWDGVRFRVLHPAEGFSSRKSNDWSCVLKIESPGGRVLLTGDIERRAELALRTSNEDLRAEVLQAPHHGSLTSSGIAFLDAVHPALGLISAGYRNRFGHPRAEVVVRYRERSVKLLDTPSCGRIQVRLEPGHPPRRSCARDAWLWAWRTAQSPPMVLGEGD